MMEQPILKLPEWDQPFFIICDASQIGIGAVVAQEHDGFEHSIVYFSKSLTSTQRNYHSYELEVLALVQALKAFDSYTWGTNLKVVTDCRALAHWNSTATVPRHVSTYLSEIQAINPQFIHRPGALIPIADALSRDSRFNQYREVTQETVEHEPFDTKQLQSDLPGRWK